MIIRNNYKSGFSLLELSVTLLAISLLMTAVVKGSDLISQSRLIAARDLTTKSPVLKIDGLALWLETTMPESFDIAETVDGGSISTWYNLSGKNPNNEFNATQNTSSYQPAYDINAVNGLPALNFNGSNFVKVSDGFDDDTETLTIFLVWKPTAAPSGSVRILEKWAGSGAFTYALRSSSAAANTYLAAYNGSSLSSVASTTLSEAGVTYVVSARRIKNDKLQLWINGTQEGGDVSDNASSNTTNDAILYIGSYYNATAGANGYIAEVIIYKRALSTQERQDVEHYLGQKWDVSIS
jgi:prepilin-type N-terminal cleavage/methylation domain-containing protein